MMQALPSHSLSGWLQYHHHQHHQQQQATALMLIRHRCPLQLLQWEQLPADSSSVLSAAAAAAAAAAGLHHLCQQHGWRRGRFPVMLLQPHGLLHSLPRR
jgi:hypothetical protein